MNLPTIIPITDLTDFISLWIKSFRVVVMFFSKIAHLNLATSADLLSVQHTPVFWLVCVFVYL